jgi:predicted GTPase
MNNILIFGHCGAGKSSLANILANTTLAEEDNESFRTFFDTKKTEAKEIKDKEKQYRIIDTRGTGSLQEPTETAKEIIQALRIANQEEGIRRIILKLRGKIEQNLIEP